MDGQCRLCANEKAARDGWQILLPVAAILAESLIKSHDKRKAGLKHDLRQLHLLMRPSYTSITIRLMGAFLFTKSHIYWALQVTFDLVTRQD